jgi:hypothetical protein
MKVAHKFVASTTSGRLCMVTTVQFKVTYLHYLLAVEEFVRSLSLNAVVQ